MYHRLTVLTVLSLVSITAQAVDGITQADIEATVLTPEPVKFERNLQMDIQAPTVEVIEPQVEIGQSDDLVARINQALVAKEWALLESLLIEYRQSEVYNVGFDNYAQGAMLRSQGKYKAAISKFEQLLAQDTELIYPKFDYAIMLYENKQYRQSQQAFEAVRPKLPAPIQAIVDQYLKNIDQASKVDFRYSAQYEQTDNVNNASSSPTVKVGDWLMQRTEDSLPQSANGVRYNTGANKVYNITGNHYWYNDVDVSGVHYWDNREFSETTGTIESGYLYQDFQRQFQLTPMISYNLLGGNPYNLQYGLSARYQQSLTPKMRLSLNAQHYQKRYEEDGIAKRYNGYLNAESAHLMWFKSPKLMLMGGVELSQDRVADNVENSTKQGVMIGGTWTDGAIGVRLNARYAVRRFDHEHYLFDVIRRDEEQRYTTTLWHNKIAYKGWLPKLNYQYHKIDSNIPDLYSRSGGEFFVSIDRSF
ncbi:porin family protein [Moraxella pluranimalium]|uniref:DUF560 domain-containing protein n=1 Tax=Moraxella pluranimalium TaxID=470453 RepID=A0A1T0CKN3_9GAMM|nr:porin family protein [Moraxella pluranimalium]OOS22918.1 hypothetical protein B0680_08870 [Moraxella pluranimalium]